jgi:PAS domain S-box-containing protein
MRVSAIPSSLKTAPVLRPLSAAIAATRRSLIGLALLCVLAAVALGTELLLHQANREREVLEEQTRAVARAAAAAVDREIAAAEALLQGLASSPALRSGDLEAFHRQMMETRRPPDTWIVLLGNPPDQLANTALPNGAPIAASAGKAAALQVIETRRSVVGNVTWGDLVGRYVVGVAAPVLRDGDVECVLFLSIDSRFWTRIFNDLRPPAEWTGVLFDGEGNTIASSGRETVSSPRLSRPPFWASLGNMEEEGTATDVAGTGGQSRTFVAFRRSTASGWVTVAEVPMSVLEAPMQRAVMSIAGGGGVLLLVGFAIAHWVARRVRVPLENLDIAASTAESAQREAEARYRAYWENTHEALFAVDVTPDGRFVFDELNPEHERLSGLTTARLRGKQPHECLPPDIAEWVTGNYRGCVEARSAIRYEEELALPGGIRHWETLLVPVCDPISGRVSRLLGTARDITERKRSEQVLRESEARFRTIADHAPVLIWISGPDKKCTYFNKPWLDFTGRSLEMEAGEGWTDGVHREDLARCIGIHVSHFDRREPFRMEYRLRRSDGEYRWIDDTGVPRFAPDGAFLGYIGSAVDVTERRGAEDALRQSEELFRAMAETVPDILFTATPSGGCQYVSPRFYEYTGVSGEVASGFGWAAVLHPNDRERILTALERAAVTGEFFEEECRLLGICGAYRWFVARWRPIRDAEGCTVKWFGAITDIDEVKRVQEDLRDLAGQLLSAQDNERRRIARELHDSTAQNLVGASLGIERALRLVASMPEDAKGTLRESLQLLDQSQQEIRTVSYLLHPPLLDEAGLPSALRWYVEGFTKRSGIAVDIDVAPDLTQDRLPQEVETALYRVAQEALGNVHRHSGSITARVRLARLETGRQDVVSLTIEDDGPRTRERTSPAFSAMKPALPGGRARSGLGVGVAGMRERMRQLGGRLELRSRSSGTTVHAMVPIAPTPIVAPAKSAARTHAYQ